ncbi:uncharacterized protein LOC111286465 isoform X1 [Durio zibethinus]|uniref:Uncharacterized protein LOC111286465 isoform X1 n=1 Tax=Durio zibethinus TaxID=66656 RepID=A0A6P5XWJ4_DURZI|nr:uncharacterized protein LOC111286465 isoform X1 [Durio zibethinus]XP_022732181.1 uncharacterized protein LOC111286465 isoform X1 [Durio zibethinus]XP_022732182.1 uncharacterized protein LOC111286465 isoform X1 [Durio zibethinus]XP_022732183.1 uncharacterized protein LOC111286465 isoform X1 [Durio zibethinus]
MTREYITEGEVHLSPWGLGWQCHLEILHSRHATEHQCGIVVKGPRLSGNISGTDPLKDNRLLLEAKPLDDTDEARHTAVVVNKLSREILKILVSHPLSAKRLAEGKNI